METIIVFIMTVAIVGLLAGPLGVDSRDAIGDTHQVGRGQRSL